MDESQLQSREGMTIEEQIWEQVCKRTRYRPKAIAKLIPCSVTYVELLSRKWVAKGIVERLDYKNGFYYKIKD
jgi:hypothetical protein